MQKITTCYMNAWRVSCNNRQEWSCIGRWPNLTPWPGALWDLVPPLPSTRYFWPAQSGTTHTSFCLHWGPNVFQNDILLAVCTEQILPNIQECTHRNTCTSSKVLFSTFSKLLTQFLSSSLIRKTNFNCTDFKLVKSINQKELKIASVNRQAVLYGLLYPCSISSCHFEYSWHLAWVMIIQTDQCYIRMTL